MKKILMSVLLCGASLAFASPSDDAKAAAENMYAKLGTFADTAISARAKYAEWLKAQKPGAGVKFGQWYVSQALERGRKNALAFADPQKNGINLSAVYGREPLWRPFDIKDGTVFNLHDTNHRLLQSAAAYVARKIESDGERDFVFTSGSASADIDFYLNGEKIGSSKAGEVKIFEASLKKGENILSGTVRYLRRMSDTQFYFAPYADPAIALAEKIKKDFPTEYSDATISIYYSADLPKLAPLDWFAAKNNEASHKDMLQALVEKSLFSAGEFEARLKKLKGDSSEEAARARIKFIGDFRAVLAVESALGYDVKNVRAAMEDIKKSYPEYDAGGKLFAELAKWEKQMPAFKADALKKAVSGDFSFEKRAGEFKNFASGALLANPLLKKTPKWVLIKRDKASSRMGLPQNWQGNSTLACNPGKSNDIRVRKICDTYKDEIYEFDIASRESKKVLFKPAKNNLICDLDISFDGKKILFSTLDNKMYFRLDELDAASGSVKTLTPSMHEKIDYFDGIYLPDGKIMFCSTACWVGVPCVHGTDSVANLYVMNPAAGSEAEVDKSIRQLTFEQDADWMPTLMENGRIMYTRWEYVDNSHYFSRILMHMNPDGTAQSSLYGSVSYWPNSLFYARQIPGDPNKFVGIVSGHHGVARAGELHLFDISKGTKEEQGRVRQYPSYGRKYVAETKDELVRGKWPQILHPYPLSEKYIVASARHPSLSNNKMAGESSVDNRLMTSAPMPLSKTNLFGVYLIDKFDNMTLLQSFGDAHAFEPMPLAPRQKPSEIADKTNRELDYGHVFLNDIYQGDGLKDVPRGTVKALRILEYHYAYRDMGSHDIIGNEGSWDVKRIHGTVPVLEDGSAMFRVPANRPLALQPLDKDGRALALMRTWFTVMPGEVQSCVGCHEAQGMSPTSKPAMASRRAPSKIKPFVAGVRGYSFLRDVQPVLDKYCAGCHDGSREKLPNFKRGVVGFKNFPQAYLDLAKFVRRSGPECNQNMLTPMEFNSDTSELMHILKKGHKGVKLDEQSMKILITWMDLNVPCYGTWTEIRKDIPHDGDKMRRKYLAKYANRHDNQDEITYDGGVQQFVSPGAAKKHKQAAPAVAGFPFDAGKAAAMAADCGLPKEIEADLGGEKIRFVLVPAGSFVMGSNKGYYDEGPAKIERVEKPFYMSQFEITNSQYAKFDPSHNSGYHDRQWKDHVNRGYPANKPNQPVVRVNWNQASAFANWLSKKIGAEVKLPTEKQWEWAARAGTSGDFWFGKRGDNYGACENLADFTIRNFAVNGVDPQPRADESPLNAYTPRDDFANDGQLVGCDVGLFKPNAFGLYDMLGNVSEWTRDDFTETLGGAKVGDRKAVRGGSWRDRAKRARVSMRRDYHEWQKVYNVGIRLVIEDAEAAAKRLQKASPLPAYKPRDISVKVDNVPHD